MAIRNNSQPFMDRLRANTKTILKHIKSSKNNGRDIKLDLLVDYGLHAKDCKFKLHYNQHQPSNPYNGMITIGDRVYSYTRNEIPAVVWEWVVDWYFWMARFYNDARFPEGFTSIICNLVQVPFHESEYHSDEVLNFIEKNFCTS